MGTNQAWSRRIELRAPLLLLRFRRIAVRVCIPASVGRSPDRKFPSPAATEVQLAIARSRTAVCGPAGSREHTLNDALDFIGDYRVTRSREMPTFPKKVQIGIHRQVCCIVGRIRKAVCPGIVHEIREERIHVDAGDDDTLARVPIPELRYFGSLLLVEGDARLSECPVQIRIRSLSRDSVKWG